MKKAQHYAFNIKQDAIIQRFVRDLPFISPVNEESGYLKHPLISGRDLCHVFTYEYRCPIVPFLIAIILKILEDSISKENRERCVQYGLLIPLDN